MRKPTLICEVWKRLLRILAFACILVFPQESEAREDWAATVYGASQLRGDIWQTFYGPDFDTSDYFIALAVSRRIYSFTKNVKIIALLVIVFCVFLTGGISAAQNREVIAIEEYIMSDGETMAVSEKRARINAIPFYAHKTTLIADVNRAIAVGYDPPTTSCIITKEATQGRNVDIYEHEKQDPIKQYLLSVSIRSRFSGTDVLGDVAPEEFWEYDAAANFKLPWAWYSQSGWGVGTRLMASIGALYGSGETALVVSFIPLVALGSKDGRFTLDLGTGGALLSRQRFGTQDYGGLFQFALTAGVGVPLYKRLGVGYRYLHYSDAGIYGPQTTGADFHMLEIIYRF